MKLSGRLAAAASLIPKHTVIADIGTDHGYIPVYMCQEGRCPKAIAADIVPGPLQAAVTHVRQSGLADRIDCRLGDGLTCIRPGEADGAVICGMGGPLMVRILQASPGVWQEMDFLVLQPQSDSGAVRQYLYEAGWHIEAEEMLVEDGRLYEMMRAVPGREAMPAPWLCDIGPVNWQRKHPLLVRKIESLIGKKEHIRAGWTKSRSDMSAQIQALDEEIRHWREIIWQLQSER